MRHYLISAITCTFLFLFSITHAQVECPGVTDYDALMSIYNATDGPNWTNNNNWGINCDLNSWDGVTAPNGRVTRLILSNNNNLDGYLPAEIGDLTELTHLYIRQNVQLTGPIPPEIGNLSKLRYLYLDRNRLSGAIPIEIGNLSQLINMYFYTNQNLTGDIPSSVGNISTLRRLYLQNNDLSGEIPSELGDLSNLTHLYLQNNEFEGCIPPSLSVHHDQIVNLSNNVCLSHDGDFSLFCEDTSCDNVTPGCSCAIPDYDALMAFYESTNGDNWSNNNGWWTACDLDDWYGLDLNTSNRVTKIIMPNNNLTGSLPAEVGDFEFLTQVRLANNNLTGQIPTEIGELSNLTYLQLDNNSITGPLPIEIGNLSKLNNLRIRNNGLAGPIPSSIGSLSKLLHVFLDRNDLTGSIPIEIGNLSLLRTLYLYNNYDIAGEMPSEIGNLSNLITLHLNNINFSGSLPPELGNLSSLKYLYLTARNASSNKLTGEIPMELGNLNNLIRLQLNNHDLTGEIPSSLGSLNNLTRLWLNGNELEGCIPSELSNLCGEDVRLTANSCLSHGGDFTSFCNGDPCEVPTSCLDIDYEGNLTSLSANSVMAGDVVSVQVQVVNVGTDDASTTIDAEIGYYLSTTNGLDGSEILLGTKTHPNLPSGFQTLRTLNATIPISTAAGSYYIIVRSDNSELFTEEDELNNLSFEPIAITLPPPQGPDYEVSSVTPSVSTISSGESLNIEARIKNSGNQNATAGVNSTIGYYLSDDASYNDGDILLGTKTMSDLQMGYIATRILSNAIIPESVTAGTYYIIIRADINNDVDNELDEWNNDDFVEIIITPPLPQGPDYEIFSITPSVTSISAGEAFDIEARINNSGNQDASVGVNSTIGYYLSDDTTYDVEDVELGIKTMPDLQSGFVATRNLLNATIPIDAITATHYIIIRADKNNDVDNELDESNNEDFVAISVTAVEPESICDNNIDDDGDGLIDCLDGDCTGQAACPCTHPDYDAMSAMYWSLGGPDAFSQFWNIDNCNVCEWSNVNCTNNRVTNIYVEADLGFFSGQLPFEFGDLTFLETFEAPSSQIIGPLPTSIQNLQNLKVLDLSSTAIGSTFPMGVTTLSNLEVLKLRGLNITGGIPEEIGNLTSLLQLDLNFNSFDNIPSSLFNHPSLKILELFGNDLSGSLPLEFSFLTNLEILNLAHNNYTGPIPIEYGNLQSLSGLILNNNQLDGELPGWLPSALPNINSINLSSNQFSGCIPSTYTFYCTNSFINLYNNQCLSHDGGDIYSFCAGDPCITSTDPSCQPDHCSNGVQDEAEGETGVDCGGSCEPCACPQEDHSALMALYNATGGDAWIQKSGWSQDNCDVCSWSGVVCDNSNRVSQLQLIDNNLVGSLPEEIGAMSNLTSLVISNNIGLTEEIPQSLNNLTSLDYLVLSGNNLSGSVPATLGELFLLKILMVNGNQLTGEIPPSIGNLSNLVELRMNNNLLDGLIPIELAGLPAIKRLYLNENNLSGCIPPSFNQYCGSTLVRLNCNPCLSHDQGNNFASFCDGDDCVISSLPECDNCAGCDAQFVQNEDKSEADNTKALKESETDTNWVNIYPNPTKDMLYVESSIEPSDGPASVALYDITGKLMQSTTLSSNIIKLDMSSLHRGSYILHIENEELQLIKKIVKVD